MVESREIPVYTIKFLWIPYFVPYIPYLVCVVGDTIGIQVEYADSEIRQLAKRTIAVATYYIKDAKSTIYIKANTKHIATLYMKDKR